MIGDKGPGAPVALRQAGQAPTNKAMRQSALLLLTATAVLGAFGCKKEGVQVYQAPKDPPEAQTREAVAPAPAEKGKPPWTVPDGWSEAAAGGDMRIASYAVTAGDGRKLDISVVPLSGPAGTDLDNINRWRNQVGLGPITADQLAGLVQKAEIGKMEGKLVDLASEKPMLDGKYKSRLLVATLSLPDTTVFFKMFGEDGLAQENRAKFVAWIKSVSTDDNDNSTDAAPPTSTGETPLPASHPSAGPRPVASTQLPPDVPPPPSASTPLWTPPASWKAKAGSTMRVATFEVPGDGGESGDLSVVALGPAAGDVLANVNRWRKQFGLGPVDEAGLAKAAPTLALDSGGSATFVALEGAAEQEGNGLLAAMVKREDKVWFYKLTGPAKLIAKEKDNFTKFVAGVKYP
jgi:hypothetical protein